MIWRTNHISSRLGSSAPLPPAPRRRPCPRTLQEDLQLGVAHAGVAALRAVLLRHGRAAVLQDVLGEAAPVLGDGPLLLPLADEAHLAGAGGQAAVRHVAGTQQLVCGHEEGAPCAMGPPRCPAWGTLAALGTVTSVLKALEPNFTSGQPETTVVRAGEGSGGCSAQGSPS